jgi:hypothetical protein
MPKQLIILLILACGLWQCTEVTGVGDTIGREYYPVQVGNYWIYDISETTYTRQYLHAPADSITYQVRERVDTVYRDQTGALTYKVIRSRRSHAAAPWGQDSIVTINKSFSDLRYTRDNLKIVKLVFPVSENKKWNGNAYNISNDLDDRDKADNDIDDPQFNEYHYAQVGQPFTLGDTTYNPTVRVVQVFEDWGSLVLNDSHEVYALGVGMIYKRIIRLDFCNSNPGETCPFGKQFVVSGRRIIQQLTAYGRTE